MIKALTARQFTIGLILLAVLPPIGIGWLIYLSRWQWLALLKHPRTIWHDHVLLFILLLLGITLLSWPWQPWPRVWLSALMLVVLLNLWLLCRQSVQLITWTQIRHYLIYFGAYLTLSGNLFHWLNRWQVLPTWVKFLTGDLLWGYRNNVDRLFGSADNPNDACCLLLIALAVALVQLSLTTKPQWLDWGLIGLLILGIYQTQSRTGLLLMGLMVIGTSFRFGWQRGIIVTTGLIGISLLSLQLLPRSYSLLTGWHSRLQIWHNSWLVFTKSPWLGVTYFGFVPKYLHLTGQYVPHAHDILIMVLASFGLLGGLGFIGLVLGNSWQLATHYQLPHWHDFAVVLPVILAYGISDFVLSSLQVLIIVLLILAHWWRSQTQVSPTHRIGSH